MYSTYHKKVNFKIFIDCSKNFTKYIPVGTLCFTKGAFINDALQLWGKGMTLLWHYEWIKSKIDQNLLIENPSTFSINFVIFDGFQSIFNLLIDILIKNESKSIANQLKMDQNLLILIENWSKMMFNWNHLLIGIQFLLSDSNWIYFDIRIRTAWNLNHGQFKL